MTSSFDIVVVGAGAGGCALAARVADQRPDLTVALLESGPASHPGVIHAPFGIAATVTRASDRNYAYETVPQKHLNNRKGFQPRGRGVGGSTLINAMLYIRGQKQDYDAWATDSGCTGWGWDDVLPYFREAEGNERGGDALHGADGPLNVADLRDPNPFAQRLIDAAVEMGFKANRDFNGPEQEGVGYYQVCQKGGERWNAGRAFIEGRTRANLSVIAGQPVLRVIFDGRRATGVAVATDEGEALITARREVVLAAGAFGSPQLLLASGVGPSDQLVPLGVSMIHDLPAVGTNLQDHLDYTVDRLVSTRELIGVTPGFAVQFLGELKRYKRERRGLVTSNVAEAGGFLKSRPELDRPDLQLHICISPVDNHGRKRHFHRGFAIHVCVLRPKSRGTVTLASADSRTPPLIDPRFLDHPDDMADLIRGVRVIHRILDAPSLSRLCIKELYDRKGDSDEALRRYIRDRSDTIYHPVGTCRMGGDAASVVDPALRVRGLEGLRVADASVMPTLISGNTQAPAIMIGQKGADLLLADLKAAQKVA